MPDAAPKGSPLLPTRACPRAHRAGSVSKRSGRRRAGSPGSVDRRWLGCRLSQVKRQKPHKDAGGAEEPAKQGKARHITRAWTGMLTAARGEVFESLQGAP